MLPEWRVNQVVRLRTAASILHDADARRARSGGAMSEIARSRSGAVATKSGALAKATQCRYEPGQSVLDGLRWIRVNKDPIARVSLIPASTPMPARNA